MGEILGWSRRNFVVSSGRMEEDESILPRKE